MHLPNVPQSFGKTLLLLLGFSASTFIRPAVTEPLPETPNSETYSDFTEFTEVDIVIEDSELTLPVLKHGECQPCTVEQFQKYSTTADDLLPDKMSLSTNSPVLAQAEPEVESEELPPGRPAILNLGSQQRWSFSAEALLP